MSEEFVMNVARNAILTTLLIAAPLLLISLVVGLSISVFQATTQIQEQTLTFVPKIVAIFVGVLVFGGWMLNTLLRFATAMLTQMGTMGL